MAQEYLQILGGAVLLDGQLDRRSGPGQVCGFRRQRCLVGHSTSPEPTFRLTFVLLVSRYATSTQRCCITKLVHVRVGKRSPISP